MEADEVTIDAMRQAAQTLRSVTSSVCDEARALKQARDAIDAALTERVGEIESASAHYSEDATSTVTWARRELQMAGGETKARIRAHDTLRQLPHARRAFTTGQISLDHVKVLDFGMRHVGAVETIAMEENLTLVAATFPPARLTQLVRRAKAIAHPEELDEAWIRGMAKRDLNLAKTIDGWHVTGFLPIDVGAKFKAMLASLAVPRDSDDARSAAERRCDGLDDLLTRVLADGLPTDGTVRPQIHVSVDAATLKDALAPDPASAFTGGPPAELVGFGPIGPQLLKHLTTGADLQPILIDRITANTRVLDVGRRHRHATPKQREAIWTQQDATCSTRGCENPIDHLHHTIPWSQNGPTNLTNLTGNCAACHHHTHTAEPRPG